MPTWGQLLERLAMLGQQGQTNAPDIVRREALAELASYTKRNVILYASGHIQKTSVPPELVSITDEDVEGFMEVIHGLTGTSLDLILHSPGGRPEATEAIVKYLRSKFRDIRAIIPHQAMSAATMLACAADQILMARHSSLGPIDPQIVLNTPLGTQSVPAQAILEQFELAKKSLLESPSEFPAWIPLLQQYGPALLIQSTNALNLARQLVKDWLAKYMLRRHRNRIEKAERIADVLADHSLHLTHGRPLDAAFLRRIGLRVSFLEVDNDLQDRVLTVYHATMHTFSATPATKIIENQHGRAFIKLSSQVVVPMPMARPFQTPPGTAPQAPP